MPDDFSALDDSRDLLDAFAAEPLHTIRHEFQRWLNSHVEGARLSELRLVGRPRWLTLGEEIDGDPDRVMVVAAVFAVAFELRVELPDEGEHGLEGVFTWRVRALTDAEPEAAMWFDVAEDIEALGTQERLLERVQG